MDRSTNPRPGLFDYITGERLRAATRDEERASKEAAERDGGSGVITVTVRGTTRSCYVV